jgi:FkbM family methyltransferase
MSFTERFLIATAAYLVPPKVAWRLARASFASQGVGWACPTSGLTGSGEASFLKRHLAKHFEPCVFDVGANVGDYSEAALFASHNVQLHCFEPSQDHLKLLRKRLPTSPNIKINAFGLSDTTENRGLQKDSDVSGLASLIPRDLAHLNIRFDRVEDVKLETGDKYVCSHNIRQIDLVKIDVEGWEMSVLKGFKDSFAKRIIRCVQFEFGHAHIERRENFRDFYRFFVEQGFTMGVIKPNGQVLQIREYDEIFENYYATNYVAMLSR